MATGKLSYIPKRRGTRKTEGFLSLQFVMAAAKWWLRIRNKDKDDYYAAVQPTKGEKAFRKPFMDWPSKMSFVNNFIKIILRNSSEQSDKINEVMKKQKFKIRCQPVSKKITQSKRLLQDLVLRLSERGFGNPTICCVNRTFHPDFVPNLRIAWWSGRIEQ